MARVTLAVAVVASLTIAAPAARAAGGCEVPSGAHVLKRSDHAVVYRTGNRVDGCLDRVGEPVFVMFVGPDDFQSQARIGAIALAGPYAAYVDTHAFRPQSPPLADYARVRRVDLRTQDRQTGMGSAESFYATPNVPRLLMAPDGAVAFTIHWIETPSPGVEVRTHSEVRTRDVYGRHYVDDSPDLDLESLRRRGRTVTWMRGGERHHTHLATTGSCRISLQARIKAHSRRVVVYAVRNVPERSVDLVACFRGNGHRFTMASESRTPDRWEAGANFRVNGRYVAWSEDFRDGDGSQRVSFHVYDLQDRDFLRSEPIYEHGPETANDFVVRDLVLSRRGDVAWTRVLDPDVSVEAWDACGRRELDDEPAIDPESLRLAGRIVTWTANGADRSAQLRSADDC